MNRLEAVTTICGLVVAGASTVAGTTIWALLTSPAAVAEMLNGVDGHALRFVVHALSEVLAGVVRYL
jgi:hypothetical protein